jgi:hypothetical protein
LVLGCPACSDFGTSERWSIRLTHSPAATGRCRCRHATRYSAHLAPPFAYAQRLREAGYPEITTEITEAWPLYCAEDYHQQYLAKNPWGYCGLGGTGVSCPVGVGLAGKAS